MSIPSVAYKNPRTTEFARLFDIFDRVATRRARAMAGSIANDIISADDVAHVPAEFAPVLKSLSTVLSIRAERDCGRGTPITSTTTGKSRRNTVSGAVNTSSREVTQEETEEAESPSFPLAERYPFTFKLMLHKLYDLEEWADKVKSALEASKSQFKPLAEKINIAVKEATGKERASDRKGVGRSRSHSTLATGANRSRISGALRERTTSIAQDEGNRALKKRCVGRRKSVSGPMAVESVWVYDAAISAMEVNGSRSSVEITLSGPKDKPASQHGRIRHRSLAALEGAQARETAKRKVRIAVPLPREEGRESDARLLADRSKNIYVKDIPRKRRAMESVDNVGSIRRDVRRLDMAVEVW
ncbi:hypothetical protein J3A83DRAFT_4099235 [Scleroderma citrinum]